MSAGQSLRRQSYHFAPIQAPARPERSQGSLVHGMRIALAVASVVALDVAVYATISMMFTGR